MHRGMECREKNDAMTRRMMTLPVMLMMRGGLKPECRNK